MIHPDCVIRDSHSCEAFRKLNEQLIKEGYVGYRIIKQTMWRVVEMDDSHSQRDLLSDISHCPYCGGVL